MFQMRIPVTVEWWERSGKNQKYTPFLEDSWKLHEIFNENNIQDIWDTSIVELVSEKVNG
jgi:hypothetical protein